MSSLPATHFLSQKVPYNYYGHSSTSKMNAFIAALKKHLPKKTELAFYWSYDPYVPGRYPHVHFLLRCLATISIEMVRSAWASIWPDEVMEDKDSHIRPVDDIISAAQYITKYGENAPIIRKQDWYWRMSGTGGNFLVTDRHTLFTHEHYRQGYQASLDWDEQISMESALCEVVPQLMGCEKVETPIVVKEEFTWPVPGVKVGLVPSSLFTISLSVPSDPARPVPCVTCRPACVTDMIAYSVWPAAP